MQISSLKTGSTTDTSRPISGSRYTLFCRSFRCLFEVASVEGVFAEALALLLAGGHQDHVLFEVIELRLDSRRREADEAVLEVWWSDPEEGGDSFVVQELR